MKKAKKWFGELEKSDWTPNSVTYTTLIPALSKGGDHGKAFELCRDANYYGIFLRMKVFKQVVEA